MLGLKSQAGKKMVLKIVDPSFLEGERRRIKEQTRALPGYA